MAPPPCCGADSVPLCGVGRRHSPGFAPASAQPLEWASATAENYMAVAVSAVSDPKLWMRFRPDILAA